MKTALRFSLRARLLFSFGLILLLTAVLGVFAISSISSENSHVNQVATKVVPGTSLAGQAAALYNKYRKDQLHYILSTPAQRAGSQGVDGDLAGDLVAMAQVLKQYRQQGLVVDARNGKIVDQFEKAFALYVQQSSAFKRLAATGKIQEAGQVVGAGAADNTFNVLKATSAEWLANEASIANAAASSAHSTYTTGVLLTVILLVLTLVAGVGAAVLIYRRVVGGVRKVSRAAVAIAGGEFDQELSVGGNDELSDMVIEFHSMVDYLGEMAGTAARIADGDLTSTVEPKSERDQLGTAFQRMNSNLRVALGDRSSLVQVAGRLNDLNDTLGDLEHALTSTRNADLTVPVEFKLTPIESQDGEPIGELAELFNSMLARVESAISAYNAVREDLQEKLGDHSSLAPLSLRLESLRTGTLTNLRDALRCMSEGDLRVEVAMDEEPILAVDGEQVGRMAEVFNATLQSVRESITSYNDTRIKIVAMLDEISHSSETLSSATGEMAQTSEEQGRAIEEIATAINTVAAGAEEQVRSVEDVRRVTDELASASRASASSADETANAAAEARELAREGVGAADGATAAMQAVRESSVGVSEAIRSLGEKSDQIGGIVETITGIAAQTNLLALNAAIEAARAGEHGRGFAVVAEEVRHLAEESQEAAATIGSLIEQIQAETAKAVEVVEVGVNQTHDGVATVEQTRDVFLRIGESVEDMSTRVEGIAASVRRIAVSSDQVRESMEVVASVAEQSSASTEEVSASTEQSSASTQQITASAQQLAGTAEELDHLVSQFVLA
ncbi:MAG: methyl-accepting chemotaxis protein [Solirubrobacteraceae bacterium]